MRGAFRAYRIMSAVSGRIMRGGIVLLYHRIAEDGEDPQGLAVSPAHFDEHLEVLRRSFLPTALGALAQKGSRSEGGGTAVAITFDDGYVDNLTNALPALERFEVPATLFVTTGRVGSQSEFWWDDLQRLAAASQGRLDFMTLHDSFRDMGTEEQERQLKALREAVGMPPAGRPARRVVTAEQLLYMSSSPMIEVGAHTISHPLLARMEDAALTREIVGGKRALEEILGQPVPAFSYPFGGRDDFDKRAVMTVRRAGFVCACANWPGLVRSHTAAFKLPRYCVRNTGGDEFERRMRELSQGRRSTQPFQSG